MLAHEGKDLGLALDCLGCGGPGPFADPLCLGRALDAMLSESGADTLTASGHVETQLRPGGMAVLERIVQLGRDLDHLSQREPPRGMKGCDPCRLRPRLLFSGLRGSLLRDAGGFSDALKDALGKVGEGAGGCEACLSETAEDLLFTMESYESMVRFVVRHGFQIIV